MSSIGEVEHCIKLGAGRGPAVECRKFRRMQLRIVLELSESRNQECGCNGYEQCGGCSFRPTSNQRGGRSETSGQQEAPLRCGIGEYPGEQIEGQPVSRDGK